VQINAYKLIKDINNMVDNYPLTGIEIEGTIRKEYEEAVKLLRDNPNAKSGLEKLCQVFASLEKSRPISGREIAWTAQMVTIYRNLGRMYQEVIKEFDAKLNISSLKEYGITDLEELRRTLEEKKKFDELMKKKGIPNYESLQQSLSELNRLKEKEGNMDLINERVDHLESQLENLKLEMQSDSERLEDFDSQIEELNKIL
jgi:hypothetical protein